MTSRSSDLQLDSDLDGIRNPCDVFTFELKNCDRRTIWSIGVFPGFGGGGSGKGHKNCLARPSKENFWFDQGVIWGRFGVILVTLECRITVCNWMFCQIRKRLNGSVVSERLKNVLSCKCLAFFTSLAHVCLHCKLHTPMHCMCNLANHLRTAATSSWSRKHHSRTNHLTAISSFTAFHQRKKEDLAFL